MKLKDLTEGMELIEVKGNMETDITGMAYNSKEVMPGDLFAAVPGTKLDGHEFINEAVERGAVAVLVSRPVEREGVSSVRVHDVRMAMGRMSGRFFENPSHDMELVGITGTNGKTTVTYILEAILNSSGRKAGVIGTVNYRFPGNTRPAPTTTPESVDIQRMLSEMRAAGVDHVFMEVSSHALDQRRVSGLRFGQAIFTNLSQDHLDYHSDMEKYFLAKKKLFTEVLPGSWEFDRPDDIEPGEAVINADDPYGLSLVREVPVKSRTYGMENEGAEVRGRLKKLDESGIEMEIESPEGGFGISSGLLGRHNAVNITAAVASALALGLEPEEVSRGAASIRQVPGRLEPVRNDRRILVLVDYAHTPDALEKALTAAREVCRERLIVVFGCGGDRDRKKRPIMGRVAAGKADLVVVTSDNPRTEDPMEIIDEILTGLRAAGEIHIRKLSKQKKGYMVEPNREKAINIAVKEAEKGDVILIAGKGHEDYQIIGKKKIHFDDREIAAAALGKGK